MSESLPTKAAPKPRDPRALNAARHSLTGQINIQTPADLAAYEKHCAGYRQSLSPDGPLEIDLVQYIADDRWRLKRAVALENSIFAEGLTRPDDVSSGNPEVDAALAQGRVWLEKGGSLQLLSLYENRIQRRFEKNMAELRVLRAERKAVLQQTIETAALLIEDAESKGETFDMERDFPRLALPPNFVFSFTDLARLAAHHRRLANAKKSLQPPRKAPKIAA